MTEPSNNQTGIVRSIAWRPTDGQPMEEIEKCTVISKKGMDRENRKHGKREVSFVSVQSWNDVCKDMGQEIPWTTRRANFLIDGLIDGNGLPEGLKLSDTIGKTLAIGKSVRVHIHKEAKPCQIMEDQYAGLKKTIKPDFRGGVLGQVTTGGVIQIGDEVTVVD